MRLRWVAALLALVLSPQILFAQGPGAIDSVQAQIRQTLRAWYFSLAHGDWNAVTTDILAAKVVAHRLPPADLLRSVGETPASPVSLAGCAPGESVLVAGAVIRRSGDWADVRVPRCGAAWGKADGFRLIYFEQRWRFVYINLVPEVPLSSQTKISDRR
jgi:hypothetical protein